jgi:hypothetical protein
MLAKPLVQVPSQTVNKDGLLYGPVCPLILRTDRVPEPLISMSNTGQARPYTYPACPQPERPRRHYVGATSHGSAEPVQEPMGQAPEPHR